MKVAENNSTFSYPSGLPLESKSQEKMLKYHEDLMNSSTNVSKKQKSSKNFPVAKFWASLFCVFILNLANLVISYTDDSSNQFIFYIFIGSSFLALPVLILTYKRPSKSVLLLLYTLVSLHLIFTDACIYPGFTSSSVAPISNLQLLVLTSLIFSSVLNYRFHLTSTLLLSLLSISLLLSSTYPVSKTLLDFFILAFVTLYISLSNFNKNLKSLSKDSIKITPLEEVLYLLETTSTLLYNTSDKCGFCKEFIGSALNNLSTIFQRLQKSKNVYSSQLEKITKNMDEEDKVFIEQNVHDSESIQSFEQGFYLERRSRSESAVQISKLGGVLKNIGKEWNFNTFFLKECSEGCPLEVAGLFTLARYRLDSIFELKDPEVFLKELESKYLPNPYHNSCHGADVMSSFMFFLTNSDLFPQCTDLELLACIISTLGHDAGHPAKNNRFLIITKDSIAIQYNDISILESMHSTIVFQLIIQTNLMLSISHEQWCIFRKICIEMILATDMSKHFDILETFKTKYSPVAEISRAEVRFDLFKVIIKASDIGHAGKNIDLHKKWCEQVIEEFYTQGDQEKKLGLPVSMYCDRDTTNIGKSQSGFIKNIVLPLFISLNTVLCSDNVQKMCIDQLESNKTYWENYSDISRQHTFVEKLETQHSVIRRRSSLPLNKTK